MIIKDKELGDIKLVANARAKKIVVRRKDDFLQLTHPSSVDLQYIKDTIEEMKPRLLKLAERAPKKLLITPDIEFSTFSFGLKIIESLSTNNYYLKLKDGVLSVSCPANTDHTDASVQKTLRGMLEKAFRYEANRLFPAKIEKLAKEHGFSYTGLKINKSRTRWGSCSSKKCINLSYYCMLLPEYLVDFIILHELCHTVEMNHGERFWNLLDKVSGGKAKEFTKALKAHTTNW